MSIEASQIQKTLYSYAAILNFTPSPQGLRAKFGACSVQNAQLLCIHCPSLSNLAESYALYWKIQLEASKMADANFYLSRIVIINTQILAFGLLLMFKFQL